MSDELKRTDLSRRQLFETVGKTAILTPLLRSAIVSCAMAADETPLNAVADSVMTQTEPLPPLTAVMRAV